MARAALAALPYGIGLALLCWIPVLVAFVK